MRIFLMLVMLLFPVNSFADPFADVVLPIHLENVIDFEANEIPRHVSIHLDRNKDGKVDLIVACHLNEVIYFKKPDTRVLYSQHDADTWLLKTDAVAHQAGYIVMHESCYFYRRATHEEWLSIIHKTHVNKE